MKKMIQLMTCAVVAAMSMEVAKAALNIPSDGSDGALVITNNTVIDLSQAVIGNWNTNNSANAGKGVYDPSKWAVVFKYSSVIIQGGSTLTFKNHGSRPPVVWLVQGDVTISGIVSLNGQSGLAAPWLSEPGPGGFRGGSSTYAFGASASAGFGPGGGQQVGGYSDGGAYGSQDSYGHSIPYGNQSLIPLIGGSGGASYTDNSTTRAGAGAGAGAILIAAAGQISIAGASALIRANGGDGGDLTGSGGSGGGIRLVADTFAGDGTVQALGGSGHGNGSTGGVGRIRIERITNTYNGTLAPTSPSVVQLDPGATPVIWMPTNGPSVRIVSISGIAPSADPRAEFGAVGADAVLPQVTNATVIVETTNVESASVVTVRATARANGGFTSADAAVTQIVNEDPLVIRWTANVPVRDGYSAVQVKVVRP
jgi:hypothetical protein